MNTRVFTGPGQNGRQPAARILDTVKACPGISLALLCRALHGTTTGKQLQWLKGETEHGDR